MKRFAEFLGPLVCLGVLLSAELFFYQPVMSAGAADNTISADFRIGADEPLIKTKFNLFNVSKRTTADFDRDMALLKELSAQTMRTDLWLGEANERTAGAVSGTVDHLVYDYSQIDRQYKAMLRYGITPYVGFSYSPYPLQVLSPSCANGSYSCTSDLPGTTGCLAKDCQNDCRTSQSRWDFALVGEVWNEPDGGIFFHGSSVTTRNCMRPR